MNKLAKEITHTAGAVRTRIQRRGKPTLSFPLRALSNVSYHPRKGFFELRGKPRRRARSPSRRSRRSLRRCA